MNPDDPNYNSQENETVTKRVQEILGEPKSPATSQINIDARGRRVELNFEKFLELIPPERLHKILLEYISETNHQGWEFPRWQMSGVRAFMTDLMLFEAHYDEVRE